MQDQDLLRPQEACDRLKIGRTSLWRYQRDGELKGIRFGRSLRFEPSEIAAFIERRARGEIREGAARA